MYFLPACRDIHPACRPFYFGHAKSSIRIPKLTFTRRAVWQVYPPVSFGGIGNRNSPQGIRIPLK
jgi:hypothetical protein